MTRMFRARFTTLLNGSRSRFGLWLVALVAGGLSAAAAGCGSSAYVKARPLPPGVSFSGIWDSNWGEMRLTQQGKRVYGTFQYRNGTIEGTLDGDVLHFKWRQLESRYAGKGSGFLQISPDGSKLEGRWGYNDDEVKGGRWWADRAESSAQTDDSSGSETPAVQSTDGGTPGSSTTTIE